MHYRSLTDVAKLIAAKELSSAALTRQMLDRIAAVDGPLQSYVTVMTERAIASAKRADAERGGWSTPVVIEAGGRRELILSGEPGVNAYDPATGRELWFCKSFVGRGEPVPVYAHGLLYVVSGLVGNTYALRPGGNGDVSATHRVWDAQRIGGRDQPRHHVRL